MSAASLPETCLQSGSLASINSALLTLDEANFSQSGVFLC